MHLRPLLCWASIPARAPTAIATRRAGGLTRCCAGAALSPHQRLLLFSQRGRRAFTCSSAMAATSTTPTKSQTPQFSPGVDEPALTRALEPLLASAELGGRWALVPGGEGLERSFKFKTFAKTWVSSDLIQQPPSQKSSIFFLAFVSGPFAFYGVWHLLYSIWWRLPPTQESSFSGAALASCKTCDG